jgi:hypothetical protein
MLRELSESRSNGIFYLCKFFLENLGESGSESFKILESETDRHLRKKSDFQMDARIQESALEENLVIQLRILFFARFSSKYKLILENRTFPVHTALVQDPLDL